MTVHGRATDDEVERLRSEVARLEHRLADASRPSRRGPRWRTFASGVLLLAVAVLAPLGVVAVWAADEVGDTDRYVENVAPLANDPAVQAAVVDRVTSEVFRRVDVSSVTQDAVSALRELGIDERAATGLDALATPLEGAVESFVEERVTRVVESVAFAEAWEAANRAAHDQLVAVLTGEGSEAVDVTGGRVSLDLQPVIDRVEQELVDEGFTLAERIPDVSVSFTIIESEELVRAQRGFDLLSAAGRWLPVLVLALLAAAVLVANDRRRALGAAGLTLAASMFLLGLTLNLVRPVYLDAVPADQLPRDAAAAVYDTLIRFIRFNLRALLVLGLAVATGAWFAGPSPAAARARSAVGRGAGLLRGGVGRAGIDSRR